ncbi:MAG TPA: hypothetical protein VF328_24355 [Mycobacterium sp.]
MTIDGVPGRMHSKRGIDRLPEPLRRCVDQTIAAEALEGWHPTADHVDALVALVDDDVTFGDYLAQYRTRYPPEPTRQTTTRMLHRRRTYLIPGTTLLRNNFGADSHGMLADLEFVSTAGRIAGWHRRLADGDVGADDLNFRAIHQELFSDVYAWAGNYRVTELRRGEDVFAWQSSLHRMTARIEEATRAVVAGYSERAADALADQFARLYAEFCARARSTNASATEVLCLMWRHAPSSSANCSTWSGGSDANCGGRPAEVSTRPVSRSPRPSCFA